MLGLQAGEAQSAGLAAEAVVGTGNTLPDRRVGVESSRTAISTAGVRVEEERRHTAQTNQKGVASCAYLRALGCYPLEVVIVASDWNAPGSGWVVNPKVVVVAAEALSATQAGQTVVGAGLAGESQVRPVVANRTVPPAFSVSPKKGPHFAGHAKVV